MDKPRKRRGRPTGSEIPADRERLRRMADLMLVQPSLTVTAAIKQVEPKWEEKVLRRLRGKFKTQRAVLMAEAEQRLRQSTVVRAPRNALRTLQEASAIAQRLSMGPQNLHTGAAFAVAVENARAMGTDTFAKVQRVRSLTPAIDAIVKAQNTPAMRRIQGLENMPAMRLALELSSKLQGGTRG